MIATERVLGGVEERVFSADFPLSGDGGKFATIDPNSFVTVASYDFRSPPAARCRSNDELDQLKHLDLSAFAATVGYSVDCQESSGKWTVLRRDADKVLLSCTDGRWLWRSARNGGGGSILDFAMHALGVNLGQARKALREWTGLLQGPFIPHTAQTAPEAQQRRFQAPDRKRAMAVWSAAKSVSECAYLSSRGISVETQARFSGSFREDQHGHVIFALRDASGICGYERRWHGLKVMGRSSARGLWCSPGWKRAGRLLVVESPVDAMSHGQLYGDDSGYISIGGQLAALQRELLATVIGWCSTHGKPVVVGTDNDDAGDRYANVLTAMGANERLTPASKDWNSDLEYVNRENR